MTNKTAVKRRKTKIQPDRAAAKKKLYRRPKIKINRSDLCTVLWLILFFPIGLTRMWLGKCSWKNGLKYAVSGLCVALCAAVICVPSPYRKTRGGVEIIVEDPEVEIYGPSAPQTMINGYTSAQQESVVVDSAVSPYNAVTVFAAEGAKCYHLGDCKFAYASAKRLTVYEAYFLGYKPCGACTPPVYDPVTGITAEAVQTVEETPADTTESVFADTVDSEVSFDTADGSEYGDFDDGSPDDIV